MKWSASPNQGCVVCVGRLHTVHLLAQDDQQLGQAAVEAQIEEHVHERAQVVLGLHDPDGAIVLLEQRVLFALW